MKGHCDHHSPSEPCFTVLTLGSTVAPRRTARCSRTISTTALPSSSTPVSSRSRRRPSPRQSPSHRPYRPDDRARRAFRRTLPPRLPPAALTSPSLAIGGGDHGKKELFGAARSISECAPYPCAVHTCPCGTGELREECATFIT